MPETGNKLLSLVDAMFDVFEQVHILLCNWKPYYHTYFIEQLWKLKQVESDFYALGYDEEYVLAVKQAVYYFVFADHTEMLKVFCAPVPG